ncbi:MAG: hypothetical protein HY952_11790 [Elusimicrobia bacterium]|nr:hypothetical protein [Elusimicrobiota bacterium]
MAAYFTQHLDYLFFFYGLAFILLAAVCFTIKKEDKSPLLWNWLGYFGLAHGLHEWLDLLAFSFYDGPAFILARAVIMGASFYFLAAFGRRSKLPLTGKALSPWIYLPLTILGLLGWFYGPAGFNASTRYAIGLPGGLLAAYAAWLASARQDAAAPRSLRVMAVALGVYAFAAGAVVPGSDLLPARYFNYSHFTQLFGFHVQLLRGALAALIACAAWSYSLQLNAQGKHRARKGRIGWSAIAALLLAVLGGWALTDLIGSNSRRDLVRNSENLERILHNRVDDSLAQAEQSVAAMAGSPWISEALGPGGKAELARTESVLDRYCASFGLSVCYLLDLKGTVVATSNRNTPQSLMGKNYGFRPYFADALAGNGGNYFALGVTTGERGFYASAPIKKGGKLQGVAVIKKNLNFLAAELRLFPYVFLVSPEGIIFLSSRKEMVFRSLWPVPAAAQEKLSATSQFGKLDFSPLLKAEILDDEDLAFAGDRFYVSRSPFKQAGWSLIGLASTRQVRVARFAGISISFIFCGLLLIFFLLLIQSEAARENAEALLALKEEVETLSGILPICAGCKKIRDDKGYWSKVETYISKHSQAHFSHGLCPDCAKKLYPGYAEDAQGIEKKQG